VYALELDPSDLQAVVIAVKELDPQPREARWGHLSLCVLDATFSISARYEAVVAPVVHRYASWASLPSILFAGERLSEQISPRTDEQTLSAFLETIDHITDESFASDVVRNRNRTSATSGVLKSAASRMVAQVLVNDGIETLGDVSTLMADLDRVSNLEAKLAKIPGSGTEGVRTGYLWMAAGDDFHVKPDRHVLRWLAVVLQRSVTVAEARELLAEAARELGVTPWSIDHVIWKAARRKR
jgi:hypothetical protein